MVGIARHAHTQGHFFLKARDAEILQSLRGEIYYFLQPLLRHHEIGARRVHL